MAGGQPTSARIWRMSALSPSLTGILVPGGCMDDANWTPSAAVHLYHPAETTRGERSPLFPKALCAYALTTDGERAYLFGGWDGTQYTTLSYAYNPATQ
jgi:hypothetical protein